MTLDEHQLTQALTAYAEQVEVTSEDTARMQRGLTARVGQARVTQRRRTAWTAAVAAAVVVLLALVAGTWWQRRDSAPIPATPDLRQEIIGTWRSSSNGSSAIMIFHANGAFLATDQVDTLLNIQAGPLLPTYTLRDQTLAVEDHDPAGQPCRTTARITRVAAGRLTLSDLSPAGPGCTPPTGPQEALTLVKVSPAPALDAPDVASQPSDPVTARGQLTGVWLLSGTAQVLAVGPANPNTLTEYRLDHDGDLDLAADDRGSLTLTEAGDVTLKSLDPGSCADTTLDHPVLQGAAPNRVLTVDILSDPCHHFTGQRTISWTQVM